MLGKKTIRLIQTVLTDEHVAAILLKKRPSPHNRQPVVEQRSEKTTAYPGQDNQGQRHLPPGRQIPCRRHYNFAGKREKGGFKKHHDDDTGITPLSDRLDNPTGDCMQ